jgi:hypothetical protein
VGRTSLTIRRHTAAVIAFTLFFFALLLVRSRRGTAFPDGDTYQTYMSPRSAAAGRALPHAGHDDQRRRHRSSRRPGRRVQKGDRHHPEMDRRRHRGGPQAGPGRQRRRRHRPRQEARGRIPAPRLRRQPPRLRPQLLHGRRSTRRPGRSLRLGHGRRGLRPHQVGRRPVRQPRRPLGDPRPGARPLGPGRRPARRELPRDRPRDGRDPPRGRRAAGLHPDGHRHLLCAPQPLRPRPRLRERPRTREHLRRDGRRPGPRPRGALRRGHGPHRLPDLPARPEAHRRLHGQRRPRLFEPMAAVPGVDLDK